MKILMLGQTIGNENLGCVALTYSAFKFFEDLNKIENLGLEYYLIDEKIDRAKICDFCKILNLDMNRLKIFKIRNIVRSFSERRIFKNVVKSCDVVFDLTYGDSFSDIYGVKRFLRVCLQKHIVYKYGKKMILGPQTYGPYKRKITEIIAKSLINKADILISRDVLSVDYLKSINCKKEIHKGTDLAFKLPYINEYTHCNNKIKVGLNVSGLLWEDKKNSLNLLIDYRKYISEIINFLCSYEIYELKIVSHVLNSDDAVVDNDCFLANTLAKKYNINLSPSFKNPVDAKSYISSLDILIGSRMHATIAGVSTGIATIPVSYSRKFFGVFNNLGYEYVIDGQALNTSKAVQQTISFIKEFQIIKDKAIQTKNRIDELFSDEKKIILDCIYNLMEIN